MTEKIRVLVVDDESDIRELLDMTLARMGLACDCAANITEARHLLGQHAYRLCLTDMRMPDGDGIELVRHIEATYPTVPVAVITAHGSTENAVAALKAGAFDYLSKPVSLAQLRTLIKSALALPESREAPPDRESALTGNSPPMVKIRGMIAKVARSEAPVYITGESGSGKELAARLIHRESARSQGAFVAVNCGAIPENLMESEFFGYRKGAFTGAEAERDGFFQAADGGTLFLDEVADLPLAMQVKLLRAIQERKIRKMGVTTEDAVNVRVISATHQDLKALVEQGRFRQDLYYRLNVIEIRMPSLRECRDDIPMLANSIVERQTRGRSVSMPKFTAAAIELLQKYTFPGNVRELENMLERALALLDGDVIDCDDLHMTPAIVGGQDSPNLQDHLDNVERQVILDALQKTRFNRTAAARLLGVTFRSLRYRMERLGLNDPTP
ncbi:MAG: sigma-54 dependent transcriptional regulator [Rhodocyclaceae bacterium]|nr:sigma-54 dependent transcriptional regulator [Rhodocyclaceae bacterium]MDZ4213507.1 sigma-54 dependent transcriptional regulator [Rhodocyclaceae bacterium]